jgi:hypothetical protein
MITKRTAIIAVLATGAAEMIGLVRKANAAGGTVETPSTIGSEPLGWTWDMHTMKSLTFTLGTRSVTLTPAEIMDALEGPK